MDFVKLCLILTIGAFLSSAQAQKHGQTRLPRSSTKEDNHSGDGGYGSGGNANYQFQYAVTEGLGLSSGTNGNDFGHEEERNGQVVRGQYRVLLPDGRRQVVTYTADKDGYRAEVKYETVGGGAGGGYSAPAPPPKAQEYGPPPAASENKPVPLRAQTSSSRRVGDSFVRFRGQNHNYNYSL